MYLDAKEHKYSLNSLDSPVNRRGNGTLVAFLSVLSSPLICYPEAAFEECQGRCVFSSYDLFVNASLASARWAYDTRTLLGLHTSIHKKIKVDMS